jgi:transposase
MKFNRSERINQRIQSITTHHLVVGIDIAKETHVAGAVTFRGLEIGKACPFQNNQYGYTKLLQWVSNLQQAHGLSQIIIGMEATGHYGFPLADWLRNRGIEVVLVNPMTTKRNKENRDNRPSKNDAKDAIVIADLVSRGYYHDWVWHQDIYRKLRCVVNEQEALADDLAAIGNRVQMLLDQGFPEFTKVFKDWNCPRGLATLKAFSMPQDLLDLTIEQIIERWRAAGMKRAGGPRGLACAALLLSAARSSVGLTDIATELGEEIKRWMGRYEQIQADKGMVETKIKDLLNQLPEADVAPFKEVGLSPLMTASILANTGPLTDYKHGQQVLALAGLNLCESTSGKHKGKIVLSKRGRRQLRKVLYMAMLGLVTNNKSFKQWHEHNVKTLKMKKQLSIFKLIGKLLRILVALARTGKQFEASKANALLPRIAA